MRIFRKTAPGAPPGWMPPSVTDTGGRAPSGWARLIVGKQDDVVVNTVHAAFNGPPRRDIVETTATVLWWADAYTDGYQERVTSRSPTRWAGGIIEGSSVSLREVVQAFERGLRDFFT